MSTRDKLKEYFQTGSVPTQQHFAELIDSSLNRADDQISVGAGGQWGLGTLDPNAVLDIRGRWSPIAGTVSVQEKATQLVGSGTFFDRELSSGATVQVRTPTGQHPAVVDTIERSTHLTLSEPFPDDSAANGGITVYREDALLHIGDSEGSTRLLLDARGRLGVGVDSAQAALHVEGDVRAESFHGSGAYLSDLPAPTEEQLPQIPASKIKGKLQPEQIERLPASMILGLPTPDPVQPAGIDLKFYAVPPCLDVRRSEGTVSLYWQAPAELSLDLHFIRDSQIVALSTEAGDIEREGRQFRTTVARDTTFTLTATRDDTVVRQEQVRVSVLGGATSEVPVGPKPDSQARVNQLASRLATQGMSPGSAVATLVDRFHLGEPSPANVSRLATALLKGSYGVGEISQYVSGYYEEHGQSLDVDSIEALFRAVQSGS